MGHSSLVMSVSTITWPIRTRVNQSKDVSPLTRTYTTTLCRVTPLPGRTSLSNRLVALPSLNIFSKTSYQATGLPYNQAVACAAQSLEPSRLPFSSGSHLITAGRMVSQANLTLSHSLSLGPIAVSKVLMY